MIKFKNILSEAKKYKPNQKISKQEWGKIKKFNKHIGKDGKHYVTQLTNKGTTLVPVVVEGKLNEEKYVVASIYGDLYTPKAVSRNVADKLMMKLAKQYAGDNVFVLGVKYWNKPHKYNKKKIMAKEGKLSEGTVRINTNTDAEFHSQGMALIGKKAKIGLDKKAMKSLLQIIKNKLGNSLACENTIDEAGAVLNNGIKIDVGFGGVTFFARNGQKIPLNRSELERFVKAIHKQAKVNCW